MKNNISLSIVLPNYNHGHYLDERLPSLLEQLPKDGEIIFVDDCSTDDSLQKALSFAQKDNRLIVLQNEKNKGHLKALAKAMKQARGRYIYGTASDDILLPHSRFFEMAITALEAHPSILLCFFDNAKKYESSPDRDPREIYLDKSFKKSHKPIALSAAEVLKQAVKQKLYIPSQAVIFKREVFDLYGSWREDLGPLSDLFISYASALQHGAIYIPETVAVLRLESNCYSVTTLGNLSFRKKVVKRMLNLLHEPHFKELRPLIRKSTLLHDIFKRHKKMLFFSPSHYDFLYTILVTNLKRRLKKHMRSISKLPQKARKLLWMNPIR